MTACDAAKLRAPEGMTVTIAELVALAREHGRADDPAIRQKLARLHCYPQVGQWNAAEVLNLDDGVLSPFDLLGNAIDRDRDQRRRLDLLAFFQHIGAHGRILREFRESKPREVLRLMFAITNCM